MYVYILKYDKIIVNKITNDILNIKKTTLIQSSRGSVFSVFGEEELNQITEEGKRKVAVSGKINEPGIIEVPENATLNDIIDICGGIFD